MKVLMVLTSHDKLGASGEKTGFWPRGVRSRIQRRRCGSHSCLSSRWPAARRSKERAPSFPTEATQRFNADRVAQEQLALTIKLANVSASDYDAVFYPGGHGPLWDLAEDRMFISLIEKLFAANKPVGAVCHAPGALRYVRAPDGAFLVRGKKVTGFSNTEEDAVGLTKVVPFLVEDMLKNNGGIYSKADNFRPHVVVDGDLVTGQNPASSAGAASAVIRLLDKPR